MNVLVVSNPRSGSYSESRMVAIRRCAERSGIALTFLATVAGPDGFTVPLPDRPPDGVWVVGGDGTFNIAVQALVEKEWFETPLLLLPGGTANVLSHEFGILSGGSRVLPSRVLRDGVVRPMDVGVMNTTRGGRATSRVFLMSTGSGFDSAVTERVHAGLKSRFGRLAYLLSIARSTFDLGSLPRLRVTLPNGSKREGNWILVANATRYADNIRISEGDFADGRMEGFLFDLRSPLDLAARVASLAFRRVADEHRFSLLRGQSLSIEGARFAQVDGDLVEVDGRLEISFLPRQVRIHVLA